MAPKTCPGRISFHFLSAFLIGLGDQLNTSQNHIHSESVWAHLECYLGNFNLTTQDRRPTRTEVTNDFWLIAAAATEVVLDPFFFSRLFMCPRMTLVTDIQDWFVNVLSTPCGDTHDFRGKKKYAKYELELASICFKHVSVSFCLISNIQQSHNEWHLQEVFT